MDDKLYRIDRYDKDGQLLPMSPCMMGIQALGFVSSYNQLGAITGCRAELIEVEVQPVSLAMRSANAKDFSA